MDFKEEDEKCKPESNKRRPSSCTSMRSGASSLAPSIAQEALDTEKNEYYAQVGREIQR